MIPSMEKQLRYEWGLEGTSCVTLSRDRAYSYRVHWDSNPVERAIKNLKRHVFRYSAVDAKSLVAGIWCKLGERLGGKDDAATRIQPWGDLAAQGKNSKKKKKMKCGDAAAAAKSLQSCPTLCDPRDGSPPGSPVPGILQARTMEWVAISVSNAWKWKVKVKSLSRVWLLATPWTAVYQAPLSMGFSRQEYWSALPLWW